MYKFLSITLALFILIGGLCVTEPQVVEAQVATTTQPSVVSVTKTSATKWRKVRYKGWVVFIPKDESMLCTRYEGTLRKHGLPPKIFSYLMWRESRCNSRAVNAIWKNGKIVWTLNSDGSYDSGLMQINSSWKTVTSQVCNSQYGDLKVLLKPDCNLRVAKYLLENGGLNHWGYKKSK